MDNPIIILAGETAIGSNLANLLLNSNQPFYVTEKLAVNSSLKHVSNNIYHYDFSSETICDLDIHKCSYKIYSIK